MAFSLGQSFAIHNLWMGNLGSGTSQDIFRSSASWAVWAPVRRGGPAPPSHAGMGTAPLDTIVLCFLTWNWNHHSNMAEGMRAKDKKKIKIMNCATKLKISFGFACSKWELKSVFLQNSNIKVLNTPRMQFNSDYFHWILLPFRRCTWKCLEKE